jgi:hypothetical protein
VYLRQYSGIYAIHAGVLLRPQRLSYGSLN